MPGHVVITGGTGFLGGHLARLLLGRGVQPLLVSRSARAEQLPPDLRGSVRLEAVDLCGDGAVDDLLSRERPTTLFHLAGARGREAGAGARCAEVNVAVTARLLEAAMRHAVSRVVMTGSAEEYGPQPAPQRETLAPQPTTLYGITKACGTALALALAEQGCPVTVVRPFTVYGPGQPAEMFLASAVAAAVEGRPFRMTEGRQRRDLVFVTDVAEALLAAALRRSAVGRVINAGSGVSSPLCEVARQIWRLAEAASPLETGARPAPAHELYDTCADLTLARELLQWSPRTDLETGLRATLDYCFTRQGKG
jgi:nucleoside-diphosphate-sugar epimerase